MSESSEVSVLKHAIPLGDRVVVLRDPTNEKTQGGIIIPTSAQARQPTGTVVSVGPKVEEKRIVVGAKVVTASYAGLEIRDPNVVQEEDFLILREEDILAIVPQS